MITHTHTRYMRWINPDCSRLVSAPALECVVDNRCLMEGPVCWTGNWMVVMISGSDIPGDKPLQGGGGGGGGGGG